MIHADHDGIKQSPICSMILSYFAQFFWFSNLFWEWSSNPDAWVTPGERLEQNSSFSNPKPSVMNRSVRRWKNGHLHKRFGVVSGWEGVQKRLPWSKFGPFWAKRHVHQLGFIAIKHDMILLAKHGAFNQQTWGFNLAKMLIQPLETRMWHIYGIEL